MLNQFQHLWRSLLRRLFNKAMASEAQKAHLQCASVKLSFGDIVYFRSKDGAAAKRVGGPTVLMLHGAGADKETWLRFAQKLPRHFNLIIPDLPAHGDSCYSEQSRYSIEQQAQRLAEFIQILRLQDIHLVGSSMGGAIAMQLVAKLPQAFASLCLIDTAGAESEKGWLQQEIASTGTNPMMEIHSISDYKRMIQIGMSKPPYIPSVFLPLLAEKKIIRRDRDAHVMRDILLDLDQREIMSSLKLPTFIIWGALDKIMHVNDVGLLTQSIGGSQSLVIPDVGHVPMVEAPALTARAYVNFLDGI